jgi:DNA (cytosine-5)-methyltransferase 1
VLGYMATTRIRVLDLFSGAGGLTAGFHAASPRFDSVRAVELDAAAAASYAQNFGDTVVYSGSIEQWLEREDVPVDLDVVVGGPPCQGFSTLGKQDVEDKRNSLWRQYAATIIRASPKYFVLENVAAFASSQQFLDLKESVGSNGMLRDYDFQYAVLNAADFGAFQSRKRAVVIGHHRDLPFPGMPEPTHLSAHRTVREAFDGVPENTVAPSNLEQRFVEFEGRRFAGAFTPKELHVGRNYTDLSLSRFAAIPMGGNRFDLPNDLKAPCWINHTSGSADVMGRLHWDKPSVTIRTEFFKPEKGRYLHPHAMRAITHYEAAILQGFPEEHKFVGSKTSIARQIGNAVPIPLGSAIARQLAKSL